MLSLPIVVGAVGVVLVVWGAGVFNRLVGLRNRYRNAFAQIDVQLKRRYDLIPNLVETVRGYAGHERAVFENVTKARAAATAATGSPAEQAAAEGPLVAALRQLFAVVENYPALQANQNFLALQQELANTEDRLQTARRFYNANVRQYNERVQQFPSMLVARMFSFEQVQRVARSLLECILDVKIGDPPSAQLCKGFHIPVAALTMQNKLDADLGGLLLDINPAVVDQMGRVDLTEGFCCCQMHILIPGGRVLDSFYQFFRNGRGILLQIVIQKKHIRKWRRCREGVYRICYQASRQYCFFNRGLDIPARQDRGVAIANGRASIWARGLAENSDSVMFHPDRSLRLRLFWNGIDLCTPTDQMAHRPAHQVIAFLQRIDNLV